MAADDDATLEGGARRSAREAPRTLTATIIAHPEARRIGELAIIAGSVIVSRAEPVFAPPIGGSSAPLDDRHLSRKPIVELVAIRGGLRIAGAQTSNRVMLDGRPLGTDAAEIDDEALERGVTLELADRVALLLHRRERPRPGIARLGLIGHSEGIGRVADDIQRVADLDVAVLVTGPTGAGKELVARAIHEAGPRAKGPLVSVSLAALNPATAASQLFGHVRGAFTGADRNHAGFFVAADGGTLFLDEVGECPADVQVMLLRVLEERAVLAVGATEPRPVDVRLVTATDADLDVEVSLGRFKSPLMHRLAGFRLRLPGLAQRRDDIARLLVHFLREELAAAREPARLDAPHEPPWLPASLVAALVRHAWPGNVRELRNVARHIVIASRGRADVVVDDFLARLGAVAEPAAHTPGDAREAASWTTQRPSEISAEHLVEALRAHGWRTGATAAALGISRTSLYMLMDKSPHIRKARDLSKDDILRASEACGGGGVDQIAATLEVSERGLKLRIRELGIEL